MKRTSVGHLSCSIARSLDVVGEWWTLLIVRDVQFGLHRFDDLQRDLGISRRILADRLATLVEHEVLERRRYQDRPERFEYHLTDKGRDLFPVLVALMRWGDEWLSPEHGGPPIRLVHDTCHHDTKAVMACAHCGEAFGPADVRPRKGPGWEPAPVARTMSS